VTLARLHAEYPAPIDQVAADRLFRTLADVLAVAVEDIDDASSPESVSSWDSLNHLNLVMAIEEEFSVSLTPDDTLNMRDVQHVRAILRSHGVQV
jgi:acyl carrier protein